MISKQKKAIFFALLAAVLYAINSPFSKLLLDKIPAKMMAAFLYLGAGVGLAIMGIVQRAAGRREKELPLTKRSCRIQSERQKPARITRRLRL